MLNGNVANTNFNVYGSFNWRSNPRFTTIDTNKLTITPQTLPVYIFFLLSVLSKIKLYVFLLQISFAWLSSPRWWYHVWTFWFSCSRRLLNYFVFPICWLREGGGHLLKIIPDTHRVQWIRYLHLPFPFSFICLQTMYAINKRKSALYIYNICYKQLLWKS